MLPFIEVRRAKQEDHDDLADVFNNQSETVTEAYGEYFLAELIAAQNQDNKALVAQVKDKAVGLMGLTNEVDTSLLHQCFELDQYDNLLKPDFMDAIRKRREYLVWKAEVEAEQKRIDFLKQMKQETLRCNKIAQRIVLQEYLMERQEDILKEIEDWTGDEEKIKGLTTEIVNSMIDGWLAEFHLVQPSKFFKDHPTNDSELVCSIQNEKEFMLSTLQFFGLPVGYMDGVTGHHLNWRQMIKKNKGGKKGVKKGNPKKINAALAAKKKERGLGQVVEEKKPEYFDILVFQKAFKKFCLCDGKARSEARSEILKRIDDVQKVFLDDFNEESYKKVVDLYDLSTQLTTKLNFGFDHNLIDNLGSMLMCFGEIEHELCYGERIPPDNDDEKKARIVAELKAKEHAEAKKAAEDAGEEFDPAAYPIPKIPEKKPILMLLHLISIIDVKFCVQRMFEFDKVLYQMELQKYDIRNEQAVMSALTKKYMKKFYEEEEVHKMPPEPSKIYSDNPEIQQIVENVDDLTTIPETPDSLKNSFAITLFCMEAAFDSRSTDFLKYAFDEYPERDYLIITQPHTVVESQLLRKFSQASKKTKNTFQHVLYIMHRDELFD